MSKILKPDGLRGIAVTELRCELLLHIGRAAAQVIGRTCSHPPVFYVAHDPRRSADALEAALCAGICSGGGNAVCLGELSSSATALLLSAEDAEAGFVLTADAQSYEYSGLRMLTKDGIPMSEEQLQQIEALLPMGGMPLPPKSHRSCGCITHDNDAAERYLRRMQNKHEMPRYKRKLRIAADCANGAVSALVKPLFDAFGIETVVFNDQPDGFNINKDCGVTSMEDLLEFVKNEKCDAGFAFDGSGERCLAVDENGDFLDGDRLLAIFTQDALERKELKHNGVAVTVMTNLGFLRFAKSKGVIVHSTEPSPRFVPERVRSAGLSLGGERGGYLFFADMPVSDGLCTALRLSLLMLRRNVPLSELASVMEHAPQVSVSVRIADVWREIWKNDSDIADIIQKRQEALGADGRILVRELPHDAVIQVLLEGRDFTKINEYAMEIAELIRSKTEQGTV